MAEAWSTDEMAQRVASRLHIGEVVNLGIGMPTAVARYAPPGTGIIFHSENGIVGMGPQPEPGAEDPDLVDAGKAPVTLIPGGAIVPHDESFGIIRGGHLDCAVLGAFQVSSSGDLANWRLPGARLGSVGGAMDIAVGARRVIAMMRHVDKEGRPKLVPSCTYPLTATKCVSTVVTDFAVIDVTVDGLVVRESAVDRETLTATTGAPLAWE